MARLKHIAPLVLWLAFGSPALPAATVTPTNAVAPRVPPGANISPNDSTRLPALPGTKTPADTLRELLNMSAAERARALADRSKEEQGYLEEQLRSFEALPMPQREARLTELELRWHMRNLMRLSPDRRASKLAVIRPDLRPLIEARLREWDSLTPSMQQEVLEYETTSSYFLRVRPINAGLNATYTPPLPPQGSERPRISGKHIEAFLQLPAHEQKRTLEILAPNEREEMEKTLKMFANLSDEQRRICIHSFDRFSRMSPAQRDQFLRNAARWQAMSKGERETWRELVKILPPSTNNLPPFPPGVLPDGQPAPVAAPAPPTGQP